MTLWIMKTLHHWFGVVFSSFLIVLSLSGIWLTLSLHIFPAGLNAFLDPVTEIVRRIHINLLNPFGIGHELVIWSGLIGGFLAGLGLIIFIPQWRIFTKRELLWPRGLSFKSLRRSHASTGVLSAFFVGVYCLTGWAAGEPEDAKQILGDSLSGTAIAIHTGEGMSMLHQVIICLLGFVIASIATTGLMSYASRWNRKIQRFLRYRKSTK